MSKFIKVQKGDEVIEVHPDALADHKRLGWSVVEEAPAQPEPESAEVKPEPVKPEAEKPKKKVVSRA